MSSQVFAGVYDFPTNHTTMLVGAGGNNSSGHIFHSMQALGYYLNLRWPMRGSMQLDRNEPANSTTLTAHRYTLTPLSETSSFSFTANFSPDKWVPSLPAGIQKKNIQDWKEYWEEGGFIDLTPSSNPNATELQRRIIQSQYHVRVNSAAKGQSPQESGLMNNGWYGRHLKSSLLHMRC